MSRNLLFIGRFVFALLILWCGVTETVQLFARRFFGTWIAGDWFLMLLASDAQELLDFGTLNLEPLVFLLLILLVSLVLALYALKASRRALLILLSVFALYAAHGVVRWGRLWTPAYLAYDTLRGIADYGALVSEGRWTARDDAAVCAAPRDAPNIVLVLGESLTSMRMGLYGYARDTTPRLSAWTTKGLTVLPPRQAFASYTAKALQGLLVKDGMSLVKRMRLKGYRPVLLSAQGHWERYCGVELMVFAACERKRYLKDEFRGQSVSDAKLLAWVEEELARPSDRPLFLIVHLMGSHFPYQERYPSYWTREPGFDDYDMSVRMTDWVVGELLGLLPARTALLFTSDHGESPDASISRDARDPAVWRVPFLVYPASATNLVSLLP